MPDEGVYFTGATCPHCRRRAHLAGDVDGEGIEPAAGDATICIKCGEWSIFMENLQMRKPTELEARELARDPNVREATKRWRMLNQ